MFYGLNFRMFLKLNIRSLRCIFYFQILTFVLWMTGLPCSGKTTIIRKLQETIPNLAVLDGDELTVDTEKLTIDQSVMIIKDYLQAKNLL